MIQLPSSALDQLLTPCLVVVDHELQVDLLGRAATRRGVPIDALVELDVGAGRCGLPFGDASLGDKVLLIPAHVDPAVNLYDRLFAWSGTEFTEWEVDGRRHYRLPGHLPGGNLGPVSR